MNSLLSFYVNIDQKIPISIIRIEYSFKHLDKFSCIMDVLHIEILREFLFLNL